MIPCDGYLELPLEGETSIAEIGVRFSGGQDLCMTRGEPQTGQFSFDYGAKILKFALADVCREIQIKLKTAERK
jgi:hypothetical protein